MCIVVLFRFSDEGVNFSIQQGLKASRSKIVYFKHNDVDALERHLQEQAKADKKAGVIKTVT